MEPNWLKLNRKLAATVDAKKEKKFSISFFLSFFSLLARSAIFFNNLSFFLFVPGWSMEQEKGKLGGSCAHMQKDWKKKKNIFSHCFSILSLSGFQILFFCLVSDFFSARRTQFFLLKNVLLPPLFRECGPTT